MKSEKLSNGFIVSYVINCIFSIIATLWINWFFFTYEFPEHTITAFDVLWVLLGSVLTIFTGFISLCILIETAVLGIKNYKKTISSNTKKKIIIMLSILGGLHVLMLIFWRLT